MSKAVLFLFATIGFFYFLFYPFLKNSVSRKRLFRWFIVLYAIALIASTVNTYLLD